MNKKEAELAEEKRLNSDLTRTISAKESELKRFQTEVASLGSEKARLEPELAQTRSKLSETETQRAKLAQDLLLSQNRVSDLSQNLAMMNKKFEEDSRIRANKGKHAIQLIKETLETKVPARLSKILQSVLPLVERVARMQPKVQQAVALQKRTNESLMRYIAKTEEQTRVNAQCKTELGAAGEQNTQLVQRVSEQEKIRAGLVSTVAAKVAELDSMRARLKETENKLTASLAAQEVQKKKIAQAESDNNALGEVYNKCMENEVTAKRGIFDANERAKTAADQFRALSAKYQADKAVIRKKLSEFTGKLVSASKTLEHAQESIVKKLTTELHKFAPRAVTDVRRLKAAHEKTLGTVARLEREAAELRKRGADLNSENSKLRAELLEEAKRLKACETSFEQKSKTMEADIGTRASALAKETARAAGLEKELRKTKEHDAAILKGVKEICRSYIKRVHEGFAEKARLFFSTLASGLVARSEHAVAGTKACLNHVRGMKERHVQLRSALHEKLRETQALGTEVAAGKTRLAESEKTLKLREGELAKAQADLAAGRAQLQAAEQNLKEVEGAMNSQKSLFTAEFTRTNGLIRDKDTELKACKERYEKSLAQLKNDETTAKTQYKAEIAKMKADSAAGQEKMAEQLAATKAQCEKSVSELKAKHESAMAQLRGEEAAAKKRYESESAAALAKMQSQLSDSKTQHEKAISDLAAQKAQLEKIVSQLRSEAAATKERHEADLKKLTNDSAAAQERLQIQLSSGQTAHQKAVSELNSQMEKAVTALRSEATAEKARYQEEIKRLNENSAAAQEKLQGQLTDTKAKYEKTVTTLKTEAAAEKERYEAEVAKLKSDSSATQSSIQSQMSASTAKYEKTITDLKSQLETTMSDLKGQIAATTAKHSSEVSKLQTDLASEKSQHESEIKQLQEEAKSAKEQHEAATKQLQAEAKTTLNKAVALLMETKSGYEKSIAQLKVEIATETEKYQAAEKALAEIKSRLQQTEADLLASRTAVEAAEKRLKDGKIANETAKKALAESKAQTATETKEKEAEKRARKTAEEELAAARLSLEKEKKAGATLEAELKEAQNKCAGLTQSASEMSGNMEAKVRMLTEQNGECENQLKQRDQELSTLKTDLKILQESEATLRKLKTEADDQHRQAFAQLEKEVAVHKRAEDSEAAKCRLLESEIKDLKTSLTASMTEDMQKTLAQRHEVKRLLTEAKEKMLAVLGGTVEPANAKLARLDELLAKAGSLREVVEQYRNKIEGNAKTIQGKDKEYQKMVKKYGTLTKERDELKKGETKLARDLETTKTTAAEARTRQKKALDEMVAETTAKVLGRLKQLQEVVEGLPKLPTLSGLREIVERRQAETATLRLQLDEKTAELETKQETIKKLEHALTQTREQSEKTTAELVQKRGEETGNLRQEMEAAKKALDETEAAKQKLEEQLKAKEQALSTTETKLKAALATAEETGKKLEEKERTTLETDGKLKSAEETKKKLEVEVKEKAMAETKLRSDVALAEESLKKLEATLKEKELALATADSKLKSAAQSIVVSEESRVKLEASMKELEQSASAKLKSVITLSEESTKRLEAALAEKEQVQTKLTISEETRKKLEGAIKERETALSQLRDQESKKAVEGSAAQQAQTQLRHSIQLLESGIREKEATVAALETAKKSLESLVQKLSADLDKAKHDEAATKKKLDDATKENEVARKKLEESACELAKLMDAAKKEAEAARKRLEEALKEREQTVANLQEQHKKTLAELQQTHKAEAENMRHTLDELANKDALEQKELVSLHAAIKRGEVIARQGLETHQLEVNEYKKQMEETVGQMAKLQGEYESGKKALAEARTLGERLAKEAEALKAEIKSGETLCGKLKAEVAEMAGKNRVLEDQIAKQKTAPSTPRHSDSTISVKASPTKLKKMLETLQIIRQEVSDITGALTQGTQQTAGAMRTLREGIAKKLAAAMAAPRAVERHDSKEIAKSATPTVAGHDDRIKYLREILYLCKTFSAAEKERMSLFKGKVEKLNLMVNIHNEIMDPKVSKDLNKLRTVIMKHIGSFPYLKTFDLKADIKFVVACISKVVEHKTQMHGKRYQAEYESASTRLGIAEQSFKSHDKKLAELQKK